MRSKSELADVSENVLSNWSLLKSLLRKKELYIDLWIQIWPNLKKNVDIPY